MPFSVQMRTLRMLRGLSQSELEALTGVPASIISHMETGKVQPVPGSEWESQIKDALGWPADDSAFAMLTARQPKEAA